MSAHWDIDEFPCPHCLVIALVKGMLENDVDPQEIAAMIVSGLKDGLEGCEGVTVLTNEDIISETDTMH